MEREPMNEGINYELKDGKIVVSTLQNLTDEIFVKKITNLGLQKENFAMQRDFSQNEIARNEEAIENAKIDAQQKLANIIKTYLEIDTKGVDLTTKRAIQDNTILSAQLQNDFLTAKIASEKPTATLRNQQVAQNNLMMPLQVEKAGADIRRANAEILQTYAQIAKTKQTKSH